MKITLKTENVPTWDEVRQMISGSKNHMKHKYWLYVALLAYTGGRRNEILSLKVGDVVKKSGEPKALRINQLKKKEDMVRKVPIVDSLQNDIKKHIARKDPEELMFNFSEMTATRKVWKASSITLGRKIRPHDLRHAFAFRMLQETEDLEKCRRLLGHSDYDTLKTYLESSQMDLSEDMQRALEA